MQVIKEIKPVRRHRVVIDLPKNFLAQEVEVIVIPYHPIPLTTDGDDWKKDFKSISQWDITEEQVKIRSWQIEEFS